MRYMCSVWEDTPSPSEQSQQVLYSVETGRNAGKGEDGILLFFTFCRLDSRTTVSAMVLIFTFFFKAEKKDMLVI